MLPYARAGGPFAATHDRFTACARTFDYAALGRTYEGRTRAVGRQTFVLRALDEQRSLLAFSELLAALAEARAPIDVIGSLTRVVRDEARHVDMCGRIVEALGGWPADAPEPRWVRNDRRLPLRRRILATVVGSLCLGESVSVGMLAGVRDHASDPVVHEVLTQMLADESYHARFGWWWLEQFADDLSDEDRRWLEAFLPKVLAAVERAARPSPEALADDGGARAASPFGSMSAAEREAAFLHTLERTITPGLERAGFDARAAWRSRPGPGAGTARR